MDLKIGLVHEYYYIDIKLHTLSLEGLTALLKHIHRDKEVKVNFFELEGLPDHA